MSASFLVTFREGLEAAVIIGILLSTLRALHAHKKSFAVWAGVLAGIIASILFAWLFQTILGGFEGTQEKIYEGFLMLLACAVITHMVFWIRKQGKNIKAHLYKKIEQALDRKELWIISLLAFTAVVREGIETVIFLQALSAQSDQGIPLLAAGLGLIAAIVLGVFLFWGSRFLSAKTFFRATTWLLIFIAAGLLAHGIVELQGAHILPTLIKPVFDLSPFLSESQGIGSFLKALFGYDANPSLLALLGYGVYLTIMIRSCKNTSKKAKSLV